jgi:CDP-diacylglycerol---serine O-phosphatidyltransferase
MAPQRVPRVTRRGSIYLLPNLLTTVGLFAGFYAIVAAAQGRFGAAASAIFVSLVTDGLDGRVARLTGTQTEFGAQYDSLADMTAFGIAPAMVMYDWMLSGLGRLGWLLAFLYTAGAALRLARFNVQAAPLGRRYFQGLPSPAAAALMTTTVWLGHTHQFEPWVARAVAVVITIAAAAFMVSSLRYYSFKELDLRGRVPFFVLVLLALGLAFVFLNPPLVLFGLFLIYAASGPAVTFRLLRRRRRRPAAPHGS